MSPRVSVVVPAHDAAATLDRTLDSLTAQEADWEAIVVDDGSTDQTAQLAQARAAADPRVTVVRRPRGGPSAARNTALEHAVGRWVLFLDADDELAPGGLNALLRAADGAPGARWLCGGWERITPDGRSTNYPPRTLTDAPAVLAGACAFAIHACLTERELVVEAGGFDETLHTCEDWDLWQRIARVAESPVPVEATVARYRVRAASQSFDTATLLIDALRVIDRGHQPPVAPDGRRSSQVAFAAYVAGVHLGASTAPPDIIGALGDEPAPDVDPREVASMLSAAVPLGALTSPARWADLADRTADGLGTLLADLERLTGTPLLARRTLRHLGQLVALAADPGPAFHVGGARVVDLDLDAPVSACVTTNGAERLQLRGIFDGALLGTAEVAADEGEDVPGAIVLDAIVEQASWPLLERLVLEPLLDELKIDADGTVRRARVTVGFVGSTAPARHELLAAAGWTLFLQELWGAPEVNSEGFYADVPPAPEIPPVGDHDVAVEVAAPLPGELRDHAACTVQVTVGGLPLDRFALAIGKAPLTPARLRAAICQRGGLELVHLSMRGALTVPARPGESLRCRLLRAAARPVAASAPPAITDGAVAGIAWEAVVDPFRAGRKSLTVLGRAPGTLPTAGIGRMTLVRSTAARTLVAAAAAEGRPLARIGDGDGDESPLLCAPGVAWARPARPHTQVPGRVGPPDAAAPGSAARSAASFEALFASREDPWGYTSSYEKRKYDQTLELLPSRVGSLLELACAEGHFTVQAAVRARRLVASDVSQLALERARKRCAHLPNVSFRLENVFTEPIAGRWDAIVCSEVLYYAGDRKELDRVAGSIADALTPGGVLVTAHANLVVDAPRKPGFDWDEAFGALGIEKGLRRTGMLKLEAEIATPMYRVQRWCRPREGHRPGALRRRLPAHVRRRKAEVSDHVPSEVRAHFLPEGGLPLRPTTPCEQRLPILMYHRVAPTGTAAGRRWRVTPAELDEQLDFLQNAGFSTITPRDWRDAVALGSPLPTQPLLLTFDDAFADFAEYAEPLLAGRRMTATIFVVSALAGATNTWDYDSDPAPLLNWSELRRLHDSGLSIGAHTRTHAPLTGLTDCRALEELAGCRLDVLEQLGEPPVALAYPYGDLTDGVRRLAAAAGYDLAFGCTPGRAWRRSDLLRLPRIEVHGGMALADLARQVASW
jgi:peptidoglycan/xylan/chitin deacetylase (PgdA/CDA1 family)